MRNPFHLDHLLRKRRARACLRIVWKSKKFLILRNFKGKIIPKFYTELCSFSDDLEKRKGEGVLVTELEGTCMGKFDWNESFFKVKLNA